MTSLITTLMLAMSLNIADAKPHKKKGHTAKRATTHQHHAAKKPPHKHATHRHHHYHVAKPTPPPKARGAYSVYFYRGHWVRTHHRPHLMWKWNHVRGKWVIVFRF